METIEELFEKYPYAFAHSAWTGELMLDDETGKPWSEEESLPKGWKKLFWQCMEDIREPLEKAGLTNHFYFVQVKEKYGSMRLYNNGATREVLDILSYYEYVSQFVCQDCGKPATFRTTGWISELCADCVKRNDLQDSVEPIAFDPIYSYISFAKDKTETINFDVSDIWNRLYKVEN